MGVIIKTIKISNYRSSSFDLILASLDHVVAEQSECEVVVRSYYTGESGHNGYRVKQIL